MLSIDWLNQIVFLLVKWWVLAAITLFLVARSRNTSAATLHAILLFALLAMCLMPILQNYIPGLTIYALPAEFALPASFSGAANVLVLLYGLVVAVLCIKYLWQIREVRRVYQCAERLVINEHQQLVQRQRQKWGARRKIQLVYSSHIVTPLTFGFFSPKILLPLDSLHWSSDRTRRFLLHELAHIRRGDWLAKLLSRSVVNLFWLVPSAWTLLGKIDWYAELACDDAVINVEGSRAEYADDLLEMTANGPTFAGAVALIETHGHYDRIAAVLDGGRIRVSDRNKFWPYAIVFSGILFLLAGVRLAPGVDPHREVYDLIPLTIFAPDVKDSPVPQTSVSDTPVIQSLNFLRDDLSSTVVPLSIPRSKVLPSTSVVTEARPVLRSDFVLPVVPATEPSAVQLLKPLVVKTPEYPKRALKRQLEGRVVVAFAVLSDGSVAEPKIVAAKPQNLFDDAVLAAVKEYRYPPQTAVVTNITEVFEFKLLEDAQSLPAAQQ